MSGPCDIYVLWWSMMHVAVMIVITGLSPDQILASQCIIVTSTVRQVIVSCISVSWPPKSVTDM